MKPRAVVRSPTVLLKEKVSPGSRQVPLMREMASEMLDRRLELEEDALVTAELIMPYCADTFSSVTCGCTAVTSMAICPPPL